MVMVADDKVLVMWVVGVVLLHPQLKYQAFDLILPRVFVRRSTWKRWGVPNESWPLTLRKWKRAQKREGPLNHHIVLFPFICSRLSRSTAEEDGKQKQTGDIKKSASSLNPSKSKPLAKEAKVPSARLLFPINVPSLGSDHQRWSFSATQLPNIHPGEHMVSAGANPRGKPLPSSRS